MKMKIRTSTIVTTLSVLALVFVAALGGKVAAFSDPGGAAREQHCASSAWPMIPVECIEGGNGRQVRMAGADVEAFDAEAAGEEQEQRADMKVRFAADFD